MVKSLVFTGNQVGMTASQAERIIRILRHKRPTDVHHGNCIGSDEQFHWIVRNLFRQITIHVHPALSGKQAECVGDVTYRVLIPLKRNRAMLQIAGADYLLATPYQEREVLRSGTWATIREAQRQSYGRIVVITPTGDDKEYPREFA